MLQNITPKLCRKSKTMNLCLVLHLLQTISIKNINLLKVYPHGILDEDVFVSSSEKIW